MSDVVFEWKHAFAKFYEGDRLTSEELDAIIKFTQNMADFGWVLPDKFELFVKELKKIHDDCKSFRQARKD